MVDLATGYGRADCGRMSGTGRAVLQAIDGASIREIRLPLTDAGLLKRLHTGECADRELAAAVEVSVDSQLTPAVRAGRPVPTRGDPHALSENKRVGVLGVYAWLGDDASRLTTITPDPAIQQTLRAFTVSGCRAAPR